MLGICFFTYSGEYTGEVVWEGEKGVDGRIQLKFGNAQRAVVAGQICAFYDGGRLLGGGVVEQTI